MFNNTKRIEELEACVESLEDALAITVSNVDSIVSLMEEQLPVFRNLVSRIEALEKLTNKLKPLV